MIRYDKKTLNQVNRIVRNYNQRVDYLSRHNEYGLLYIPEKVTVKDLKNSVNTKIDLNRRLKDLQAYTKKSAQEIVSKGDKSLSLYEYTIKKKYRDIARRQINQGLKFYEKNVGQSSGKKESISLARSGDRDYLNLIARKRKLLEKDIFDVSITKLQANTKSKDLQQWQENFIEMLQNTAKTYGYDVTKIVDNLITLEPKDFDNLTKVERTLKAIIDYYKSLKDIDNDVTYKAIGDDLESSFYFFLQGRLKFF